VPDIVSLVDEGLGNSSYLVDLGDQRALVLDPTRDPSGYLAVAERRGLQVAYAVETHLHADFVSGSRELAARGATVVAAAAGGLEFHHRGLGDGDEVDLGGLRLRALATPGHTPEHLAYLLSDGDAPLGLFSGGSLLVGAVARTDLIDPDQTEDLARALWRSLHERILTLPDDLPVYPTHGAGSFCSAPAGSERTTTIGREKAANPLLRAPDEDAFVKLLVGGLGTYPPYFGRLREVNRRGPAIYGPATSHLTPLDVDAVRRAVDDGAWVIDARPVAAFAAGHIPGAVSIQLRPAFATWLGWVVPDGVPLVFVVDDHQDRADLVRQARKIGYERLAGELAGGEAAWRAAGLAESRTPLLHPGGIDRTGLLDIRQAGEYAAGHVPGARSIELGALANHAGEVRGDVTVMCGHGERAATAASLLERAGNDAVRVVVGGPGDWAAATGQPLETTT
jgi:glyoxylase-like metal-dependent hydrolase (beta-lactamase superfamily II)/rhodanese-related sulfurtransferase